MRMYLSFVIKRERGFVRAVVSRKAMCEVRNNI
jgi:hypothetical protein